jgi:hypothetical protein
MAASIKVAVVGAGIAGLTAAYRLMERGYEVEIFDDRIHIGGKLGAHTRRIRRIALDLQQFSEYTGELNAGRLPDRFRRELEKHLADQRRRLHRLYEGGVNLPDQPRVRQRQDTRHGAAREWTVTYPKYRFNIAIHKGERQTYDAELSDDVYHEHCYHVFLNWYRNFWDLMADIKLEKTQAFQPLDALAHLFPGIDRVSERTRILRSIASIDTVGDNVLSGVASVPEMVLWFYSLADLVGQQLDPARYLDEVSVHGFIRSRWYATEQSAALHEYLLSKAFAIPTVFTSAYAYRRYLEYGLAQPEPMLWVLKGNSYRRMFEVFERKFGERLTLGAMVTRLEVSDGKVVGIKYRPSDMRGPSARDDGERVMRGGRGAPSAGGEPPRADPKLASEDGEPRGRAGPEITSIFRPDYVILALPPKALAEVVGPLRELAPSLNAVRKMQSGVTAVLDLHFTRKLPGIPKQHCILRDSRYGLTFFDNSQAWKDDENVNPGCTCLSVAATDFYKIDGMPKDEAVRVMIDDLRRFIDFAYTDIDYSRTYLQMNSEEPLFLNEVSSELWRPGPRTELPNLFVAGDFCDNEIGIVSVEGAVTSGLLAARALQSRARRDRDLPEDHPLVLPIPVKSPDCYPPVNAALLKHALTPYAAAAKAWARLEELTRHPERAVSPREIRAAVEDVLSAPGEMADDWFNLLAQAARWAAEAPFADLDRPG